MNAKVPQVVAYYYHSLLNGLSLGTMLGHITHTKCSVRSTLCWKIENISGSTEFFGL